MELDVEKMKSYRDRLNELLRDVHTMADEVIDNGGSVKIAYNNGIDADDKAFIVIGPRKRDPENDNLSASIQWEM